MFGATGIGAAGIAVLVAASAATAQSFEEHFDSVPAGWTIVNNSSPVGTTSWFQPGVTPPFGAHIGATNSYIAANYNNAGGVGDISNWLMTPEITNIQNGDTISFWTRTVTDPEYADRLELRLSTAGASTNAGATASSVGDFANLLLTVNPSLVPSEYPSTWTQYTVTVSGLASPVNGRLAFRYFVPVAGPFGDNSDFIGIDTFSYTAVPGAGSLALMGLAGLVGGGRRRR